MSAPIGAELQNGVSVERAPQSLAAIGPVFPQHAGHEGDHARAVVLPWCYDFYNQRRRHSSAHMMSPIAYENLTADQPAAA